MYKYNVQFFPNILSPSTVLVSKPILRESGKKMISSFDNYLVCRNLKLMILHQHIHVLNIYELNHKWIREQHESKPSSTFTQTNKSIRCWWAVVLADHQSWKQSFQIGSLIRDFNGFLCPWLSLWRRVLKFPYLCADISFCHSVHQFNNNHICRLCICSYSIRHRHLHRHLHRRRHRHRHYSWSFRWIQKY